MLFVRLFDLHLFGFSVTSSSWCLDRAAACNCGTPWTFLITFFLDLELNFIGKLLVSRWEQIVLLLLQINFFFVMKDIL